MRGLSDFERIPVEKELKNFIGTKVEDIVLVDKKYSCKYIQFKFSNNRSLLFLYNDTVVMDLCPLKKMKCKISNKILKQCKNKYKKLLQKPKNAKKVDQKE